MTNVLALDLGTHTGWALIKNGHIESGVQVFDVKRGESPGMRYVRFRAWLLAMVCGISPVGLVVYEMAHHRGGAATEIAAGFTTRIQEQCADLGIEHAAVHSATIKKFTTGKGNAKKPDMRDAAIGKGWIPASVEDDNEVDALALLHFAMAEIVGPGTRP